MKHQFILIILFLFALHGMSQTNSDKAKEAYKTAFEAYNKGDYRASIDNLKIAITLLGSTKVLIQDLMVKSYMGSKDYKQAKVEAQKYFALNPQQDAGYNEMLVLSGEIDKQIEIQARDQQLKEADLAAWNAAKAKNTKEAYEQYISAYSQGVHTWEAKYELERFAWSNATKINTIAVYKQYISDYPSGIHVKDANQIIANYNKELDMRNNPNKYFATACKDCDMESIRKLIEYGANCNLKVQEAAEGGNQENVTYYPLCYLTVECSFHNQDDYLSLTKLLLEKGANPNVKVKENIRNPNSGWDKYMGEYILTYLNADNQQLKFSLLKLCVEHGMDVNQDDGAILRDLTESHGNSINCYEIIEYLLKKGANPNLDQHWYTSNLGGISGKHKSAMQIARKNNQTDLVNLFKKYK